MLNDAMSLFFVGEPVKSIFRVVDVWVLRNGCGRVK